MIIAGAGGHAREVLDVLLETLNKDQIFFFDDHDPEHPLISKEFRILRSENEAISIIQEDPSFCIGVGSPAVRKMFCQKLTALGALHTPIRSKKFSISNTAKAIGVDCMAFSFMGSNSHVGNGSLVNTGAQIHHDAVTGKFCEIGPGAKLLGKARIGNNCSIGANAIILPGISLGSNSILGAGAVLTKNAPDNSILVGVPARPLKTKS